MKNLFKDKVFISEAIKTAVIAGILVFIVRTFLIHPFIVKGISMEHTFSNNDYLIVDRLTYRFEKPKRGDIVVFKSPLNLRDSLIKRIIGLPGETVVIKNGYVFIKNKENPQGRRLDESSYLSANTLTYPEGEFKLKEGYYFVMGDNRGASMDSRLFGPVHESLFIGKVLLRGYPFNKAKIFHRYFYPAGL